MADQSGDELVGSGDLGADVVVSSAEGGAVASGLAADGTRTEPATEEADSTGGAADAGIEHSDDEACGGAGGSGEDGELDKYDSAVTNEPRFDEGAIAAQETVNQEVTADSESDLGLDKNRIAVTNEPKIGEDAVEVQETFIQEFMADSGGALGLDNGENEANFESFFFRRVDGG